MGLSTLVAASVSVAPPVNGKIAFWSDRDSNDEIYSMNADGSGQINLTGSAAGEGDPSWAALWPPLNTDLPVISGTPHEGQQLSCSQGTWDDDPSSYSYQWLRDGSSISGATDPTYTLVGADAGSAITCRVTATNEAGSGSATSIGVDSIGVSSNTAAPAISGTPYEGQTLSCLQGTWDNNPSTYSYGWLRDELTISGATGSIYTLVPADGGWAIKCRVTATNDAGSESSTSAEVRVPARISPAPDVSAPVTTIDLGPTAVVRDISAIFAFHANETGVGFECRVDTGPWAPCNSPEVVYGLTVGGHTFQVRAQDWSGNTGEPASWSWTVDRSAPTLRKTNLGKMKGRRGKRLRRTHLVSISGLMGDDYANIRRVKVKLKIENPSKKSKKGTCASLSLKTGRRIVNKCKRGFTPANGTNNWEIALSRRVRRNLRRKHHYRLLIRALDSVGNHKIYGAEFRVR